jgi:hypothetical protein
MPQMIMPAEIRDLLPIISYKIPKRNSDGITIKTA